MTQRSAVEQIPPGRKKRSSSFCLGGVFIGLVIFLSIIAGILMAIGFYQVNQSPRIVEISSQSKTEPKQDPLSEAQTHLISQNGRPHSFVILFYTVDADNGATIEVRDESWMYLDLEKTYQFINGELVGESTFTSDVTSIFPISCKSEQFYNGMKLDEIVAAIGLKQFLEIPLETELVPDSHLYYADRLTFALKEGKLRYVETLAMEGSK